MEAQGFPVDDDQCENTNKITFCGDDYQNAVQGADCIVIMTEWDEFKEYNFKEIRESMST
jgi:UDP-glucose 6-dehydrogenase